MNLLLTFNMAAVHPSQSSAVSEHGLLNSQTTGSLLKPGYNCQTVARARRAALLIHGEEYFKAFARAALNAVGSIVIVGWDFHTATRLHHGLAGVPELLGDFLDFLVRRRRNLRVRILEWDYPMVFAMGREQPLLARPAWAAQGPVQFRFDNDCPVGAALHQKIVTIDGTMAFCGGIDLTIGRWDTPEHLAHDSRRTNRGEQDCYPPVHDAMLVVDAAAARALHDLAGNRWLRVTGEALPPPAPAADPWPEDLVVTFSDVDVGISRTLPAAEGQPAIGEVQTLYLDMIGSARRMIYLENQYFTARELGDALAARLLEPQGPEVIAVLRLSSSGWLEAPAMGALRTATLRRLREADRHGRFFAYYPHLPGLPANQCCNLHSKLMIVDEAWLRVGSANFANRSMSVDTECDLVIEAGTDPRASNAIAEARTRLLGEHLDVSAEAVSEAVRSHGSIGAAVRSLAGSRERTLKPYENLEDPSPVSLAIAAVADPEKPAQVVAFAARLLRR